MNLLFLDEFVPFEFHLEPAVDNQKVRLVSHSRKSNLQSSFLFDTKLGNNLVLLWATDFQEHDSVLFNWVDEKEKAKSVY